MRRAFADTHFYLAFLNRRGLAHQRAVGLFGSRFFSEIITTEAVLLELADAMCMPGLRDRCCRFIDELRRQSHTQVFEASGELFNRGYDLFRTRADKEWSLTDCISFVVMTDEGLNEALTGDHHFEQAGFTALLK